MKKQKTRLCVLAAILMFLVSCSQQQEMTSLYEELAYAQVKEGLFINDYLRDDAEIYFEDGWSYLNKNGYRSGVYPRSTIYFRLFQKRPLYLFCLCMPTPKGSRSAQRMLIKVNGSKVAEEELKANMPKFMKVPVPPELLSMGQNMLEFVYQTDKTSDKDLLPEEKGKRIFSAIFQRLILSSLSSLSAINRIERKQSSMLDPREASFVQNIPGEMDFFLNIPSDAALQAKCEFSWFDPDISPTKTWKVQISLQKPEAEEQMLEQIFMGRRENRRSLDIDLSPYRGLFRLRLKADSDHEDEKTDGFLIWSEAKILARPTHLGKKPKDSQDVDRIRRNLRDNSTILIIFDAARADRFSTYGHFRSTTPSVDHFAEKGIIFQNAFSEALTTRASIGTLFTGYPLEVTGFRNIFSRLPDNLPTLAQLFQEKGFKTAGFTGVGNISSEFGFNRGFDEYYDLFREEEFRRKSQEYIPFVFPWLERNRNNKFFLYIHFKEPHAVYIPQPPFQGMFSSGFTQRTDLAGYMENARELTEEQVEYIRACYDENLASADSVFGKLIQKLAELGLLEKTNIILTSDHGEMLGEKERIFGHGSYLGEGGSHIPLVIRFPRTSGIDVPQRLKELVKLSDIFMSLVDIYQFDVKQELMVGRSFFPLFFDPEIQVNPYVVTGRQAKKEYGLRTLGKKLIYLEKSGEKVYFDMDEDPMEANEMYSLSDIEANYLFTELKKWLEKQRFIRAVLFDKDTQVKFQRDKIDKKTLENLKALGYIK